MSEKLKPCPYCQSDNVGVECSRGSDDDGMIRHFYYGFCGGCHMAGPDVSNEEGEGIAEEQAAAAWNALPCHLQWTTETPTEPGWYIYQERRNRRLCCVIDGKVTGVAFGLYKVEDLSGEWAGPITEPQEKI